MLLSIVLATATVVAPTPAPGPAPLASLKVIANVRSTPLCSALRSRVGPAIAALLQNDATIEQAPGRLNQIYRDTLLGAPSGWGSPEAHVFINRGSLEALVTPLTTNFKEVDDLLADHVFDGPALAQVKVQLDAVERQQKGALNVISGYDATSSTWDMLNAGYTTLAASQPSPRIFSRFDSAGFFGTTQSPRFQGPRTTPGRFDISLAYNPFRRFAQAIVDMRAQGMDAETTAANTIAPLIASCQPR